MSSAPIILVTAATGAQSSGLIRSLSTWSSNTSTPIMINATTRDPSSASSRSLLSHQHTHCTINLFKVDFEDASTLTSPSTNSTHAFINLTPVLTDQTAESRHGNNIISALREHASSTLQRVVYTTAYSIRDTSAPDAFAPGTLVPGTWMHTYYNTKYGLEVATTTLASDLSIPYTILRPATFLTNLLQPASNFMYPDLKTEHTITTALTPDFISYWLDPADIGHVARIALVEPATSSLYTTHYRNAIIGLAERKMTLAEAVAGLNAQLASDPKAGGIQVKMQYLDAAEAERRAANEPLIASQIFMNANRDKFAVDLEAVKGLGMTMATPEEFWRKEAKRVREAVGLQE